MTNPLLKSLGGRPLSDVMTDPVPPFLFENCFRDSSITVFVAPPHRGKTLLMLDMAICLDRELPLFGRFMPLRGRKVFFLGCDAPSWDYGLQARKLHIGHGITPAQRTLTDIDGVWARKCKLTDPNVLDALAQLNRLDSRDVLMVDTHRSTHSANENDSGEMEQVWDIIKGLRNSGWCIIMSHHTPKPTEVIMEDVHAARGSSVIGASADFIYTLNKRNRRDRRVQVRCVKGRGAADEEDPFSWFDIEPVASDEFLNGRPLYGLQLVCSTEDALVALERELGAGPKDRKALCAAMRTVLPATTKDMSDTQLYRFVDNRLTELRQLGKAKPAERGIWEATNAHDECNQAAA